MWVITSFDRSSGMYIICEKCPGGGIGIRSRLRTCASFWRGGSSPLRGTANADHAVGVFCGRLRPGLEVATDVVPRKWGSVPIVTGVPAIASICLCALPVVAFALSGVPVALTGHTGP